MQRQRRRRRRRRREGDRNSPPYSSNSRAKNVFLVKHAIFHSHYHPIQNGAGNLNLGGLES